MMVWVLGWLELEVDSSKVGGWGWVGRDTGTAHGEAVITVETVRTVDLLSTETNEPFNMDNFKAFIFVPYLFNKLRASLLVR